MSTDFNVATTATQQLIASTVSGDFQNLVKEQGFKVPDNYHVANALQEAVAMLPTIKGIENVTADSIKKSLFDMVVQGLSPAKTQVYFIAYGRQLQMQRSYFGTQQVLKRLPEIKNIAAFVVHEGEEFQVDYNEDGELVVNEHHTDFMKLDNPIVGAYAVITRSDDTKQYEVMTKKQIDASWGQSRQLNVHKKFPEEMAKRTVINRAAKNIINTTDDDGVLTSAINGTTANEYADDPRDVTPEVVQDKPKGAFARMAQKQAPKPIEKQHAQLVEERTENVTEAQNEPETTSDEQPVIEEDVKAPEGDVTAAYTVPEIKAWLDVRGMTYPPKATKQMLLDIADEFMTRQEQQAEATDEVLQDDVIDLEDETPSWVPQQQPQEPVQTGFEPGDLFGGMR